MSLADPTFPPLLSGFAVSEGEDVFKTACTKASAGEAGAGDLFWSRSTSRFDVAVSRTAGVTRYECSIPFGPMRDRIRPSEGREFCLSVLVHDCDGTGIRDWGQAAGLWSWQRNPLAWSRWQGDRWGKESTGK